jgi:hypothetical protein
MGSESWDFVRECKFSLWKTSLLTESQSKSSWVVFVYIFIDTSVSLL